MILAFSCGRRPPPSTHIDLEPMKVFFSTRSSTILLTLCRDGPCCSRFGFLAASPACFSPLKKYSHLLLSRGYSVNNAGVSLSLNLIPLFLGKDLNGVYAACLDDPSSISSQLRLIHVFLQRNIHNNQFRRVTVDGQSLYERYLLPDVRYRKHDLLINKEPVIDCSPPETSGFVINGCKTGVRVYKRVEEASSLDHQWLLQEEVHNNDVHLTSKSDRIYGMIGYLSWEYNTEGAFLVVCLGFDFHFRPICLAFTFPGAPCHNPLEGIPAAAIMDRYLSVLPEDSLPDVCHDERLKLFATRGREKGIVKRDISELNLSVRFMPLVSSHCRLSLDFDTPQMTSKVLPPRTVDSLAQVRHLFGGSDIPGYRTLLLEQYRTRYERQAFHSGDFFEGERGTDNVEHLVAMSSTRGDNIRSLNQEPYQLPA